MLTKYIDMMRQHMILYAIGIILAAVTVLLMLKRALRSPKEDCIDSLSDRDLIELVKVSLMFLPLPTVLLTGKTRARFLIPGARTGSEKVRGVEHA